MILDMAATANLIIWGATAWVCAITFTALALLAIGYAIGRIRPYQRLADWTDWQLRFHLDRWTSRPRQAALFTLLLITDPQRTVHAWRHRHDPPPPRSPAMRVPSVDRSEEP